MADASRKNVVVLGSTGSVGTQALEVVRSMPDRFRVAGLAGNSQWRLLARQVREFTPEAAVICDGRFRENLNEAVADEGVELMDGPEGLRRLASWEGADIVVSAVSGGAGLPASVAALRSGKRLALANKESMVMAGPMLRETAQQHGGSILPVDSEHSALFQLLQGVDRREVRCLTLTASGGPFRQWSADRMREASPQQALDHPTWRMGAKISIDSATLLNKALEVIEARWLFDVPADRIRVLIHPQSIVHGMVELADGALLAHMGVADMRMPIQYALNYPERIDGGWGRLDLAQVGPLEFETPDPERFPALRLGHRVARTGGTSGAVLNAANEVAVDAFLAGDIEFTRIARLVESILDRHEVAPRPDYRQVLEADRWARKEAERCLHSS
ncbi:MAG: 1-deoxy-D-xylulose-5-phosphate reductoisomerase [Planctomycetota bacterium]